MDTHILIVCLNAVLPTFLLMATGFVSRQLKLLGDRDVSMMNNLAFKVFMPAMLFCNIYTSDIASAVRPRLMEGEDMAPVAVLMVAVVPLYNALAVICLETFSGKKLKPLRILIDVIENPLIIASLLGILFAALHITLPKPLAKTVTELGKVGSPLMLFLLGAFFRFDSLRLHARDLVQVCTMRLVVIPAIFLSVAVAMGFRGVEFAGLIGVFGSSAAVASFTMAAHGRRRRACRGHRHRHERALLPDTVSVERALQKPRHNITAYICQKARRLIVSAPFPCIHSLTRTRSGAAFAARRSAAPRPP